jgi:hypothetical protein
MEEPSPDPNNQPRIPVVRKKKNKHRDAQKLRFQGPEELWSPSRRPNSELPPSKLTNRFMLINPTHTPHNIPHTQPDPNPLMLRMSL